MTDKYELQQVNSYYNKIIIEGGVQKEQTNAEKNFYTLCGLMEDNGSSNPQDYSVIQFYAKLNYINEKIEAKNKATEKSEIHGR